MRIDRDYVRDTLVRLVRIDSVNPTLAPGAPGEREIAAFIADSLRSLGLEVESYEPEPGRVTVAGRLAGRGGGRSLMLNAHCDTVGVEGMAEPFSGAVRDGKVYGRGAFDMKGSIAAAMGAAKALVDSGTRLRGDLIVAAVADEEYGSLGTADLLRRVRTDGAIVTEPTALDVCLAHKGYLWIEAAVEGRAAHGSKFQYGIDANMKMGAFLHELSKLEAELRSRRPHPLVGPPSLHAAILRGGSGLSTYAASSTVQIERRTIPGETEAQAVGEIQAIVDRLSGADPDFRAAVRAFFVRDPFEVGADAPIVRSVHAAAAEVLARPPAHVGDTPWMDAALLQAAGVETVVLGPAGAGAHADVEWVDLESVWRLADIWPGPPRVTAGSYNNLAVSRLRLALAVLVNGIAWGAAPSYSAAGIVSTGSYAAGPFAPNSLITIFGSGLAMGPRGVTAADIVRNSLPTELNSTRVYVDSFPVALLYVSETQINLLIPGKQALGKAEVQVMREGQRGPVVTVEVAPAAPALFLNGDFAIATHADNSVITVEKPACAGELIVLYAAGLGKAGIMPANGELAVSLSTVLGAFRVTVDGTAVDPARVYYAGLTPASAGLYQVNFVLPEKVGVDPEVRLFVGDEGSPVGVKLALR